MLSEHQQSVTPTGAARDRRFARSLAAALLVIPFSRATVARAMGLPEARLTQLLAGDKPTRHDAHSIVGGLRVVLNEIDAALEDAPPEVLRAAAPMAARLLPLAYLLDELDEITEQRAASKPEMRTC
jgi:hypothetical protein